MNNATKLFSGLVLTASLIACGGNPQKETKETSDQAEKAPKKEEVMESKEFNIIPNESKVMWSGSVIGVYTHEGTVEITEGNLELAGDKITGGQFTADVSSMQATDENYNPEEGKSKEKLIEHLSSDDFFAVNEFPSASFTIKSHDVENNSITGDLTIRGVTHEEVVEDVKVNLEERTASGKLTIDRKAYDVAFSHPAKDVVIKDDVNLEVMLKM
ncbi:MAG: YceI family protein [Vicingaceae bacterium]